jgi:hypothetical protein
MGRECCSTANADRFHYGSFKALETREHVQWRGDNIDTEQNVVIRMNYFIDSLCYANFAIGFVAFTTRLL